jgi:hypothetical protein
MSTRQNVQGLQHGGNMAMSNYVSRQLNLEWTFHLFSLEVVLGIATRRAFGQRSFSSGV